MGATVDRVIEFTPGREAPCRFTQNPKDEWSREVSWSHPYCHPSQGPYPLPPTHAAPRPSQPRPRIKRDPCIDSHLDQQLPQDHRQQHAVGLTHAVQMTHALPLTSTSSRQAGLPQPGGAAAWGSAAVSAWASRRTALGSTSAWTSVARAWQPSMRGDIGACFCWLDVDSPTTAAAAKGDAGACWGWVSDSWRTASTASDMAVARETSWSAARATAGKCVRRTNNKLHQIHL